MTLNNECFRCHGTLDGRFGYCPWCGVVQWNDPEEEAADASAASVALEQFEQGKVKAVPWEEVAAELEAERPLTPSEQLEQVRKLRPIAQPTRTTLEDSSIPKLPESRERVAFRAGALLTARWSTLSDEQLAAILEVVNQAEERGEK